AITHGWSGELQRRKATAVFVVLFAALLFMGCPMEDGGSSFVDDGKLNVNLIGTWLDTAEWGTDGYTVEADNVEYISDYFPHAGVISHVTNFSKAAGVIIIELDPGYEAYGYSAGTFIGIYFQNLRPGVSVQIGTASLFPDTAAELTLDDAIAAFTLGNEGTYISFYGTYLRTAD
ncbi:MAG: hypothetical protein FWG99_05525, partial [Treponema sp.]|nr:hypothetical protein [Treponema sp.]